MEMTAGFRTLENVGPNFSSSVIICLQKTPKKNYDHKICLISSFSLSVI